MDENIRERNENDPPAEGTTSAADIMKDPAAAAGAAPQAVLLKAPPGTPEVVQRVLDSLPGLVGGVDEAIRRECGVKEGLPFAFIIFTLDGKGNGTAIHAGNFDPESMRQTLINFGESLKTAQPAAPELQIPDAANDGSTPPVQ